MRLLSELTKYWNIICLKGKDLCAQLRCDISPLQLETGRYVGPEEQDQIYPLCALCIIIIEPYFLGKLIIFVWKMLMFWKCFMKWIFNIVIFCVLCNPTWDGPYWWSDRKIWKKIFIHSYLTLFYLIWNASSVLLTNVELQELNPATPPYNNYDLTNRSSVFTETTVTEGENILKLLINIET